MRHLSETAHLRKREKRRSPRRTRHFPERTDQRDPARFGSWCRASEADQTRWRSASRSDWFNGSGGQSHA